MTLIAVTSQVSAQDSLQFNNLNFGVRVIGSTSIYPGGSPSFIPIPQFGRNADEITVGESAIRLRAFENDQHRLQAVISPRFSPYDSGDDPILTGLDRPFSLDLGASYTFSTPFNFHISATALAEVTDQHDGQQFELRATQSFSGFGLPVAVYGGVTYRTDGLSQYLYGIAPSEAIAGRPAYDPGDTSTPFVGLSTLFPLTDRLSVTGAVRADFYPDAVTNSPIVDTSTRFSGTLGVLFEF